MADESMKMNNRLPRGFNTDVLTNPVISKLGKVRNQANDGRVATYQGIGIKTFYFLILTLLGVGAFFFLHSYFGNSTDSFEFPFAIGDGTPVRFAIREMAIFVVALILTVITPIIAWLIRPAIPVFGSLYALSQGYIVAFVAKVYNGQYYMYMLLALIITLSIVAVMLFLHMKRIIRVTEKLRSVMKIVFCTTVLGGTGAFILSLLPATREGMAALSRKPMLSIGISILFIIIATLFLLSDFDAIEKSVEHQLPKKYEWTAAYGLVFTVIWLYFKVFNLVMKLRKRS